MRLTRSLLFYIATSMVVAAALSGCPGVLTGTLTVVLLDSETQRPVITAEVSLTASGLPDITPSLVDETYVFVALPLDEEVTISVQAPGYLESTRTIILDTNIDELEITLEPEVSAVDCTETLIADGDFESGNTNGVWEETTNSFSNPVVCCRPAPGTGALSGDWWLWFGGNSEGDSVSAVSQVFTVPANITAELQFYFEIPESQSVGTLRVLLDGEEIFTSTNDDSTEYATYRRVNIPQIQLAGEVEHTLTFTATTAPGGLTSFFVDDVCLVTD